ncbi:MAG: phosphoglucosamine mutase [Bacteriovoracaceae bacterium]|jgi:phosphoglucosamine mutase|nr:phosphoglucosamine mutase [Bacteriovoracaceae bacterium]
MERKLFGTDGIRGKANVYPMTCEVVTALGRAITHYFQTHNNHKRPLIIVGKDTRLSCYMLEQAFSAGVCSQGGEVILTGPLPTPGVAFVTKSMRATAGVMISASHNRFDDNGIKIFDNNGFKLPDQVELEIEKLVLDQSVMQDKVGPDLGNAKRLREVFGRYLVHAKSVIPESLDLSGMRVVIDCANGAAYKIAPIIFNELGAEVYTIGNKPNGTNINLNCGSTSTQEACEKVLEHRADLGICLDGDADRVIFIDENGKTLDGDKVIGLFAKLMLENGTLKKGDTVVGTIMTNLGLENYLKQLGLNLTRTRVGDRYIVEEMKKIGAILGGEPSGHIILLNHSTTGDGSLAALKMIEGMKHFGKSLSELEKEVILFPQVIKNAVVSKKVPLETVKPIQEKLESVTKLLGTKGRVLLRYSGTESLARVMVEGENEEQVVSLCDELSDVVSSELK